MPLERMTNQDMVGPHRVGQDIEIRPAGKLTPTNKATVKDQVLKTNSNFHRASINLADEPSEYGSADRGSAAADRAKSKSGTTEERLHEHNQENMAARKEPDFKEGIASMHKGKEETLKVKAGKETK